jgi:hypothetical protein
MDDAGNDGNGTGDRSQSDAAARRMRALEERIRSLASDHALPHERERAAQEGVARLHEILDRLPLAISVKDREGRFRFANATMAANYALCTDIRSIELRSLAVVVVEDSTNALAALNRTERRRSLYSRSNQVVV